MISSSEFVSRLVNCSQKEASQYNCSFGLPNLTHQPERECRNQAKVGNWEQNGQQIPGDYKLFVLLDSQGHGWATRTKGIRGLGNLHNGFPGRAGSHICLRCKTMFKFDCGFVFFGA